MSQTLAKEFGRDLPQDEELCEASPQTINMLKAMLEKMDVVPDVEPKLGKRWALKKRTVRMA